MGIIRHHGVAALRADAVCLRHKQRLVIVAAKCGRKVILDECAFTAALTAGADFQSLGSFQDKRLVIAAGSKSGKDRLNRILGSGVSAVL